MKNRDWKSAQTFLGFDEAKKEYILIIPLGTDVESLASLRACELIDDINGIEPETESTESH